MGVGDSGSHGCNVVGCFVCGLRGTVVRWYEPGWNLVAKYLKYLVIFGHFVTHICETKSQLGFFWQGVAGQPNVGRYVSNKSKVVSQLSANQSQSIKLNQAKRFSKVL